MDFPLAVSPRRRMNFPLGSCRLMSVRIMSRLEGKGDYFLVKSTLFKLNYSGSYY